MADFILSSDEVVIPDDIALLTMQDLLTAVMQIKETTKRVVSRWIRIVFQLSMLQNPATTEGLMPQLLQFLRSDKVGVVEAHWIAATMWNKALDFYAYVSRPRLWLGGGEVDCRAEDMVTCNKWIQHAMSVSRFVGDDGMLEKLVCSFVREINWCSSKMGITICLHGGWEDDVVFICCVAEDIVVRR